MKRALLLLTLAFCVASPCWAAAAVRTTVAGGGSGGTGNRTVTIVPAVNDLLVVFCSVSVNTNASATMTDDNGSGTYTNITTALWNTSANIMTVFVRTALMVNTTSTIITCASGSNTAGELVVYAITGMTKTGAAAILQSARQENQASGTPAPTFGSAALSANMCLGAVTNLTTAPIETPPTTGGTWVEDQDASQASPTTALETVNSAAIGFTGTTVTWGGASGSAFASIIVELDISASARNRIWLSASAKRRPPAMSGIGK